jgi:hypothetical protein
LKALLRWLLRLLLFGAHWCYCAEAGMSYKLLRERRLFVSTFKSIITVSFYMEQAKQVRDITRKETCPTTCRLLRACQNTVQTAECEAAFVVFGRHVLMNLRLVIWNTGAEWMN